MEKTIRLLAKLNRDLIEEGSWNYIDLRLEGTGGGELVLVGGETDDRQDKEEVVYSFSLLSDLNTYLEASWLTRILMSRRSAQ